MDSRHVMSRLKETLTGLLSVIPPQSDIIYADYPLYGNVGDLLIMKGTEAFFKAHGIRVKQRWNPDNFPFGRRADKKTIIVCQGGGNFGDLYPYYQTFREKIVKSFPENRIVILPQSIYYQDETRLGKTAALFAGHKDLHLFTRDRVSYETAKRFFRRIISGLCLIWPISCIRSRRQRLRHAAGFILAARMGKSIRSCKTILPLKAATGRMCCQQATAGESLFSKH